jgi:hypothetical protein
VRERRGIAKAPRTTKHQGCQDFQRRAIPDPQIRQSRRKICSRTQSAGRAGQQQLESLSKPIPIRAKRTVHCTSFPGEAARSISTQTQYIIPVGASIYRRDCVGAANLSADALGMQAKALAIWKSQSGRAAAGEMALSSSTRNYIEFREHARELSNHPTVLRAVER